MLWLLQAQRGGYPTDRSSALRTAITTLSLPAAVQYNMAVGGGSHGAVQATLTNPPIASGGRVILRSTTCSPVACW